jgi:hypothetical protein
MSPIRIFKTRWFVRYAKRERISDVRLVEAVSRAEEGLVDADLGGGVVKQRVARPGQGRSGGYRLLMAYRPSDRAVFLLGFAKSDRENVTPNELLSLKRAAVLWFASDVTGIETAISEGVLVEVRYESEN